MHTTMKRYIYTLLVGALLSLTSCVMDDPLMYPEHFTPNANEGLQIIGSAADFDKINVGTRADGNAYPDSYISEMTMFVFNNDGNLIQGYDASQLPTSSAINIQQSNPTFLIEAKKYDGTGIISSMGASLNIKYFDNKADDISACSIYIVANAYHQIKHLIDGNDVNGEIKSLDDLNEALLTIDDTLAMPEKDGTVIGFPMIGHAITADNQVATFNLKYSEDTSSNAVANIPLTKVYSKVCFTMQVVANQVVKDGPTPKFQLTKVEVFNIPSKAHLGYIAGDYATKVCENNLNDSNIANYYHYDSVNGNPIDLKVPVQTIYHNSSTTITDSDVIKFEFYMPEHMVTPNPITYPDNLPEERQQYYKPKGVAAGSDGTGAAFGPKIATFVRIHGSYTDHNGRIKGVSYDIYLGQDEKRDFEVKRNQQLNNFLTITGLTNHKDAYFGNEGQENISIDHRVTMTDRGYNVYMEREAILDAHFEVRPVDFELQNGSALTIVIPEEYQSWVAMESGAVAKYGPSSSKGLYIDNTNEKRGVRKYFTTDLVSELTNVGEHTITMEDGRRITTNLTKGTITLEHSSRTRRNNTDTEHFRVWFYVDENPNVYDETGAGKLDSEEGTYTVSLDQYRLAPVKLYYTNTATDNPDIDAEAVHTINFQQWNLWRVWNAARTRYYDIEHEEEYLNNYASNVGYGPEQNGMKWGLEGIILSNSQKASYIDASEGFLGILINLFGGNYDSWINSMIDKSGLAPYYDFYLERDTRPKNIGFRNYSGKTFNDEIITTLKKKYNDSNDDYYKNEDIQVEGLTLTDSPKSAIAYCYHKNKRDKDGNVAEAKWFLPSIDEIEEISMGAYDEFDKVFQKNNYWSCQPSAFNKVLRLERERWLIVQLSDEVQTGTYMDDNPYRARATSVYYDPSDPKANDEGYVNISSEVSGTEGTFTLHFTNTGTYEDGESGYAANTGSDKTNYTNHPGNLPRTAECRIRAVYRSGTK